MSFTLRSRVMSQSSGLRAIWRKAFPVSLTIITVELRALKEFRKAVVGLLGPRQRASFRLFLTVDFALS